MSKDRQPITIEILPCELLLNIISRLPVTSLSNVKVVCRRWYKLARDPLLVNIRHSQVIPDDQCLILHCDHPIRNQLSAVYLYMHNEDIGMVKKIDQLPEVPEFDVIGLCNGLLCLHNQVEKNAFSAYNPFTNHYMELPYSTLSADYWTVFGFGVHPVTKEYKVVKISKTPATTRHYRPINGRSDVEILTLGSSAWRSLDQTSYYPLRSPSQALVNGRLHWVTWPRKYGRSRILISFDLEDEQFREVPKPESDQGLERTGYDVIVLRGCLSAAYHYNYCRLEIWIMKEYGVRESWINELNIASYIPRGIQQKVDQSFAKVSKLYFTKSFVRVLCHLRNGEILLIYRCSTLVTYHPISGTFRDIMVQGMPNWFEAMVLVGSLDSIANLTGL